MHHRLGDVPGRIAGPDGGDSGDFLRWVARKRTTRLAWELSGCSATAYFGVKSVLELDTVRLSFLDWVSLYHEILSLPEDERPSDSVIENDRELDAWLEKKRLEAVQQKLNASKQGSGGYTHPGLLPVGKTVS